MDDICACLPHADGMAELIDEACLSLPREAGRTVSGSVSFEGACCVSTIPRDSSDARIAQFLAIASRLVGAQDCLLVLAGQGGAQPLRLVARSKECLRTSGDRSACLRAHQAAAREAIRTGKPVLHRRANPALAPSGPSRPPSLPPSSIVAWPIRVGEHTAGAVVLVRAPRPAGQSPADPDVLAGIAQLLGQAFYLNRLEQITNSQFAQLAIARQADSGRSNDAVLQAGADPERLARLLAKSFYREMTKLGLDSSQIIMAASEIISQLSGTVKRHHDRHSRSTRQAQAAAPAPIL